MKDDKKIVAIIVTYNRKKILEECIKSLLNQNYQSLSILIIDNNSSDGTFDYIKKYVDNKKVFYKNTLENIGGAGGFNFGMREAYNMGCDYMWLMDDDTIVLPNALKSFLDADKSLDGNYGFLSSIVKWTDGSLCKMNKQSKFRKWNEEINKQNKDISIIYAASFVSFFTRVDVVKEIGLPIKDFYIWADDIEYSKRISKKYKCYILRDSIVIHKTKNNEGSNIAKDEDRIDRYKFAFRNGFYIAKKNGIKGIAEQFLRVNYNIIRVLFTNNKHKFKKIKIIIISSLKGIKFNPKIEYL